MRKVDKRKLNIQSSVLLLVMYVAGSVWLMTNELRSFSAQAKFAGSLEHLVSRLHNSMMPVELDHVLNGISSLAGEIGSIDTGLGDREFDSLNARANSYLQSGVIEAAVDWRLLMEHLQDNDIYSVRVALQGLSATVAEYHERRFVRIIGVFLALWLGAAVLVSWFFRAFLIGSSKEQEVQSESMNSGVELPSSALAVAIHEVSHVESIRSGHDYILELKGDDLLKVTDLSYPLIESSVCEMVRNAIIHGGRASAIRESAGKPSTIKIFIGVEMLDNHCLITVADDGEGIDEMHVLQHAVAQNILNAEMVKTLDKGMGVKLILVDGFSDIELNRTGPLKSNSLASIREAVETVGGSVSLRNRPTVFCEFKLKLPL